MSNLILNSLFQKQGRFTALMASLSNDVNHSKKNELIILKRERIIIQSQEIKDACFYLIQHFGSEFLAKLSQLNGQFLITRNQENYSELYFDHRNGIKFQYLQLLQRQSQQTNDLKDSLCQFILNGLVHACDISNYMIEVGFIYKMVILLTKEFQDQTLKKAAKRLDVTTMLKYKDKITFYYSETFFLNTFVLPQSQMIAALKTSFLDLPREVKRSLEILEEEKKKISN